MFGRTTAIVLLGLTLLFAAASNAASAAEITCVLLHPDPPISEDVAVKLWPSGFRPLTTSCQGALLRGVIEKGDFDRFRAFYRQHHRALLSVYVTSPGGDANEAMKIGRLIRKYLISTWAPKRFADDQPFWLINPALTVKDRAPDLCRGPTCICASACGIIWFGGVTRYGQVGLHRPTIVDPQFKALAPGDASTLYRRLLQEISRYLDEMEAPRPLIDVMVATSSSDIRWVDASADDDQLEHPPSFIEWADASCGSFTAEERKTESELSARKHFARMQPGGAAKPLTGQEDMLLKMLQEKDWSRSKCKTILVTARRDALPGP